MRLSEMVKEITIRIEKEVKSKRQDNQIQIVGTASGYLRPLKCNGRGILRRYPESISVGASYSPLPLTACGNPTLLILTISQKALRLGPRANEEEPEVARSL